MIAQQTTNPDKYGWLERFLNTHNVDDTLFLSDDGVMSFDMLDLCLNNKPSREDEPND